MSLNNIFTALKNIVPVLYISYDGMLDPLGQSQVIPYLGHLTQLYGGVTLISFEKRERLKTGKLFMEEKFIKLNIYWIPISFTEGNGSLNKIWDLLRMIITSFLIVAVRKVRVIHARGHLGALSGSFIKRMFKVKLLFDFRGLWVDERVDKGGWKLERRIDRMQYGIFKRLERILLAHADHIVVLTNSVVDEVRRLGDRPLCDITVIPCCADFDHFKFVTSEARVAAKRKFSWCEVDLVIGYLGSVGQMYLLDDFFRFVRLCRIRSHNIKVLAVTPDVEAFRQLLVKSVDNDSSDSYAIISASREKVPELIATFDVLVTFIAPSYARQAASPTKIAESLAQGIPVITNHGIGDMSSMIPDLAGGLVLDLSDRHAIRYGVDELDQLRKINGGELRCRARKVLGLEVAIESYSRIYKALGLDLLPCNQS